MAESEESKRPKRRLRNAETVRERALKAVEAANQPEKRSVLANTATVAAKPARGLGKLFRYQPFRFIGKVLRFIGRIIVPGYFRSSWRELRLVSWPSRKQSRQLTFAVLIFAVVFGALVSVVDYGLDKLFKQVLLK